MKKTIILLAFLVCTSLLIAQAPQKMSYQAVVRDGSGKLVQNRQVGVRISVVQGSANGTVVYTETHSATTNVNGLVSLEVGGGVTSGLFSQINWANGPYFIKTETDPEGGTAYSVVGTSQLLSVPYALYAGNGFSGDYNDLINKPVTDGSETKVTAGANSKITGTGTIQSPYVVSSVNNPTKVIIANSQNWTTPAGVSKIKVELWGGSGGGGGAGIYSYSFAINRGGNGGSGGYAQKEFMVTQGQALMFTIGAAGVAGSNAIKQGITWFMDTDGGDGGTSLLSVSSVMEMKASGGAGGKRGSYAESTVHGLPGMANAGTITAYCNDPQWHILNVFQGLPRSYISDRILTSPPGKGGSLLSNYSVQYQPTTGEGGCAIITFLE